MMQAKLAMWEAHGPKGHRCLSLHLSTRDALFLPARVVAKVAAGLESIRFYAKEDGHTFSSNGTRSSLEMSVNLCERDPCTLYGERLPAFELMAVEMDDDLVVHLPPMHLLPWPSRKSMNKLADPRAIAMEALEVRMDSAIASGLDALGNNPIPGHLREHLPQGAFLEARNRARALCGV